MSRDTPAPVPKESDEYISFQPSSCIQIALSTFFEPLECLRPALHLQYEKPHLPSSQKLGRPPGPCRTHCRHLHLPAHYCNRLLCLNGHNNLTIAMADLQTPPPIHISLSAGDITFSILPSWLLTSAAPNHPYHLHSDRVRGLLSPRHYLLLGIAIPHPYSRLVQSLLHRGHLPPL